MPNFKNKPFGLRPVSTITGATYNGATVAFPILANAANAARPIFIGDPVFLDNQGSVSPYTINTDFLADQTQKVLGVFVGCSYRTSTSGSYPRVSRYWPGLAAAGGAVVGGVVEADIIVDPNVIYEIQCSSSLAANGRAGLRDLDVGNNAYFALGTFSSANGAVFTEVGTYPDGTTGDQNPLTGSTVTGLSAIYLDIGPASIAPDIANRTQLSIIGLSSMNTPVSNTEVALNTQYSTQNRLTNTNVVTENSFNIARVVLKNHWFRG